MGILRLLFALSVLIAHSGKFFNYNIANPGIAVPSFFIISGFYMTLILDKKYVNKNSGKFLSNRFLRIFPLYWLTLIAVVILILLKYIFHIGTDDNAIVHYIKFASHEPPLIFVLSVINFIIRNITLIFTSDYVFKSDNTPGYLLIQQAWTLQAELLFYLIAPFLIKLSKKIFLIFILLYIFIFFGIVNRLNLIPDTTLTYLFFSNLIYFLLGIISYKFLFKKVEIKKNNSGLLLIIFLAFLLYLLFYNSIPFSLPFNFLYIPNILYYLSFIIALPYIFIFTSVNLIDGFIGELSYPVYITHFLIIKLLSNLSLFNQESNIKTIIVIIITLVGSIVLVKFVEQPIDKFRQNRLKNK